MELALLVYLGDFLDTLKSWIPGFVIVTIIGSFVSCLMYMFNLSDYIIAKKNADVKKSNYEDEMYLKMYDIIGMWRKFVFYVSLPYILITSLLPAGNTYHLMVGAYFTQQTIQHPETQEIFTKVKDIILKKLDDVDQQLNLQLKESKEQ